MKKPTIVKFRVDEANIATVIAVVVEKNVAEFLGATPEEAPAQRKKQASNGHLSTAETRSGKVMIDFLRAHGGRAGSNELRCAYAAAGYKPAASGSVLNKLAHEGVVKTTPRSGVYELVKGDGA